MKPMHDRSNGLGGGFAGYGIYPEYKDFYAFHMFFDSRGTRKECEAFLKRALWNCPFRNHSNPKDSGNHKRANHMEIFCRAVKIGSCIFTVRRKRISWTAHGRYPTNTPGWWGGAHPFTLLDYSVVHNGEISFAKNAAAFFRNAISFRNSSFSRFNRRFSFMES